MKWVEFEQACPQIASLARERFAKDELVMLGTLRSDGSPRISPCEIDIVEGHLCLGMMWRSKKA
ncbi:MAG: pyridoxamine 5'-phosphate oxidase family protein, partial [Actinomycetota bacterium]|nr:pyridoxamine 5'-phosphate oxidase family protein [Actinomycetota bacterium]